MIWILFLTYVYMLHLFASLIKMLYWMVKETERRIESGKLIYSSLTEKQLIHAVQRNFDGLDEFNATEMFIKELPSCNKADTTEQDTENKKVIYVPA